MSWIFWLGLAVAIGIVAAVTGMKPSGTRPVARTRLMGMARFVLIVAPAYLPLHGLPRLLDALADSQPAVLRPRPAAPVRRRAAREPLAPRPSSRRRQKHDAAPSAGAARLAAPRARGDRGRDGRLDRGRRDDRSQPRRDSHSSWSARPIAPKSPAPAAAAMSRAEEPTSSRERATTWSPSSRRRNTSQLFIPEECAAPVSKRVRCGVPRVRVDVLALGHGLSRARTEGRAARRRKPGSSPGPRRASRVRGSRRRARTRRSRRPRKPRLGSPESAEATATARAEDPPSPEP